jgi:endogenous inhibitor of DNA gyrase (YacG/DUF329 family)
VRNPDPDRNIAPSAATRPPRRCPTCRQPVSALLHVTQIAGDIILDCPTCWTTTVFDQDGRAAPKAFSSDRVR